MFNLDRVLGWLLPDSKPEPPARKEQPSMLVDPEAWASRFKIMEDAPPVALSDRELSSFISMLDCNANPMSGGDGMDVFYDSGHSLPCLIRTQMPHTRAHIQEFGGKKKTLYALYARMRKQRIDSMADIMRQIMNEIKPE